jgi:hypothetical protein
VEHPGSIFWLDLRVGGAEEMNQRDKDWTNGRPDGVLRLQGRAAAEQRGGAQERASNNRVQSGGAWPRTFSVASPPPRSSATARGPGGLRRARKR